MSRCRRHRKNCGAPSSSTRPVAADAARNQRETATDVRIRIRYHTQPASLDDAAKLLGGNEEAKLVAGGMTLVPTLKLRLAKPSDLVDLGGNRRR